MRRSEVGMLSRLGCIRRSWRDGTILKVAIQEIAKVGAESLDGRHCKTMT